MTAADDGGDAQFARDDGGVAGAAAAIGDDGGSPFHHRLPVRVGHVGDQHVARLHLVHLGGAGDDTHAAGADLLADGAAFDQHVAALLQTVFLGATVACIGLHRFGTRLQDVELAVDAVLAPFDVHRTAVMFFNGDSVTRKLQHIFVAEREALLIGNGYRFDARGASGGTLFVEHHALLFGAQAAADDGGETGSQLRLVHIELVRIDGALHHHLAQTERGSDEHRIAEAGFGIQREQHAGRAQIGTHHALHTGRQGHVGVREILVHAVRDRAVVIQRCEHFADRMQDVVDALDVQESLLLAGERRIRQVFCGGRGAHRETAFAFGGKFCIVRTNLVFQALRQRRFDDPAAYHASGFGQRRDILHIQRNQRLLDAFVQSVIRQKIAIRLRRGGKAAGYMHAGRAQVGNHFA